MPSTSWALSGIESGLLYVALGVYLGASVVGLRVVRGKRRSGGLRTMLAVGAASLSVLVAAMAVTQGGLPIGRKYEILILVAWLFAVGGLILDHRMHLRVLPAVAAPTMTLLLFFAVLLVPTAEGGALHGKVGIVAHILLAVLGLAALAFAAGVGALYLWQIRILKNDPTAALARRMPPLEQLDALNFVAAAFGFPFLALSAVGAWLFLTGELRPDWWLDPTALATLAGLLVYAALFAARSFLGWYGRRIAWLTVAGFLVIVLGFVVGAFCTSDTAFHRT